MHLMPKMHEGRRYELVFKDPFLYAPQLIEAGECEVLFELGNLQKRKKNPWEWMRQNFHGLPWRAYVTTGWNTIEIDYTCKNKETIGIYPSWDIGYWKLRELQDYIENPWARYPVKSDAPWQDKPNPEQPHKIFIRGIRPGLNSETEPQIQRRRLTQIQKAYPEVELFLVPSTTSFGLMFGSGFTASSFDPKMTVQKSNGSVILPSGRWVSYADLENYKDEFAHMGYDVEWLQESRQNEILYMIESARYAAHHWDDPTGPYVKSKRTVQDYSNPDMYAQVPSHSRSVPFNPEKIKDTDKILCNACSLWRKCPSYRTGEVCNLTGTESGRLAKLAQSRNAQDVVEMLASLVGMQADRLESRVEAEGKSYDPAIDKMANSLFRNGVQLAKLRDPNLRGPLVQINNNNTPNLTVAHSDPRAIAAIVVGEFERAGIPPGNITEEMFEQKVMELTQAPTVIDAETTDG